MMMEEDALKSLTLQLIELLDFVAVVCSFLRRDLLQETPRRSLRIISNDRPIGPLLFLQVFSI